MDASQFASSIAYQNVTILSGQTESASLPIFGTTLIAINIPAAFTGSAITIHGSLDGTNFKPLYKDGADLSVAVAAGRIVVLQPSDLIAVNSVKLVADTAQAADRTIGLAMRPF